jgi:hypothetical protein
MKRNNAHEPNSTIPSGRTRLIAVEVSVEDAKRIQQAFADGKLKELGIIDIKSDTELDPTSKEWTEKESEKAKRRKFPRDLPSQ